MVVDGRDDESSEEDSDAWSVSSEPAPEDQAAFKTHNKTNAKVVLQRVPIDAYNGNKRVRLNCLIDQGATGAFMSRKAAEALQVTGYTTRAKVTGFDGMVSEGTVMVANIPISEWGRARKHWIQVQVTKDPAGSYKP